MVSHPHALVIEDMPLHLEIARYWLQKVGFIVTTASSLLEGAEKARTFLDPSTPACPSLILTDLMLPHQRCPDLDGTVLIAQLVAEMEEQLLRPAYIIAITGEKDEGLFAQLTADALLAGCHRVIRKPLQEVHTHDFYTLVQTLPVPITTTTPFLSEAQVPPTTAVPLPFVRRMASHLIHLLTNEQQSSTKGDPLTSSVCWDLEHVKKLLLKPWLLYEEASYSQWLRQYGDVHAVRLKLGSAPLTADQRKLFEDIVGSTDSSWNDRASRLGMGHTTYYRYRKELLNALAIELNSW